MVNLKNFIFNFLLIAKPTGVWESIIFAFNTGIENYAWAIIVLTLIIKVIMLPFDFFNKKFTRKNTKMQAIIQPELNVIKKKYGNDQKILNQKTLELYKKYNYNVGGSCLFMIINLALTLFVFITLFSGLNSMADYKISQQYEDLQVAYYNVASYDEIDTAEERALIDISLEADIADANERVSIKYESIKDSWLWIDNVWLPDSPFSSSIPTFAEYSSVARLADVDKTDAASAEYEKIMNPLRETDGRTNGYLILVVLVAGLMLLQQLLMNAKYRFKKKNVLDNELPAPKMPGNKVMLVVLPLLMGFFAFRYNAVFALYLLVSSLVGVVINPLINNIIDKLEKRDEEKKKEANAVSYRRK